MLLLQAVAHRVDTRSVYATDGRPALAGCATWSTPLSRTVLRFVRVLLLTFVAGASSAQAGSWNSAIVPAPEPFTLSGNDAIHAVAMIARARILQYWDGVNRPRNVGVHSVRAVFVDFDSAAFEGHQSRYDVELNGEALDWNHTYIEYDGDMINLRLLFTYRNQRPVPSVPYRLRYDPQ